MLIKGEVVYIKSTIFIPKQINVGFQKRGSTYTGKLAYIIYFDEKGILRKETSWDRWRDKEIPNQILKNEPINGLVLNKKVGDYSSGWNHRQSYIRVYDPRDFEFEITVENLLYILENCSAIKGKGLEGKFVYGWDGKDLLLIPIDSPDYKEIEEYNNVVHKNESIKAKDLIIGATYIDKNNYEYIYMGKYDYYDYEYSSREYIKKPKRFFFYNNNNLICITSVTNKFINCIDNKCSANYSELFDKMQLNTQYSPIDRSKDIIKDLQYEEFEEYVKRKGECLMYSYNSKMDTIQVYIKLTGHWSDKNREFKRGTIYKKSEALSRWNYTNPNDLIFECKSIKELYDYLKPKAIEIYLENGNYKETEYYDYKESRRY